MSWPMFHQVYRCERLLDDMMDCVGVRPVDAVRWSAGFEFREARANCIRCRSSAECRTWLDHSDPFSTPPAFCRNAEFLSACRINLPAERS